MRNDFTSTLDADRIALDDIQRQLSTMISNDDATAAAINDSIRQKLAELRRESLVRRFLIAEKELLSRWILADPTVLADWKLKHNIKEEL